MKDYLSESKTNILIIIPARGGSKGIPRKNLRPLNGNPLIYYTIQNAIKCKFKPDVYISTDDDEIAFFALKFGVKVLSRQDNLANDAATLDPVIISAYEAVVKETGKEYELIITMQPTSPLLRSSSLDCAIETILSDNSIDTIISAIGDAHLTWRKEEGTFKQNYKERVNRQYLPVEYKETGGFLIARPSNFSNDSRIGKNISLYELNKEEAIDIDGYNDWSLCEFYLKRKKILFVVSGYPEIGLGHIYNCLGIANEILNHKLEFLVDKKSTLGYNKIRENNYSVYIQRNEHIVDDIKELHPELIINDRLDTNAAYVKELKSLGYKVANIEDLGEGAKFADVVINAIYPEREKQENHYFGAGYFCARDEFKFHLPKSLTRPVKKVLITFGGVDPCNLTQKVLEAIYDYCIEQKIEVSVIAGMGYEKYDTLVSFKEIKLVRNIKNISDYFHDADIVFSSAGRTIYELAILGTPTIVLAQNERELTHFYAYEEFGFINMGLGETLPDELILQTFIDYVDDFEKRQLMSQRMLQQDIVNGKNRVVKILNNLLNTIKDENS